MVITKAFFSLNSASCHPSLHPRSPTVHLPFPSSRTPSCHLRVRATTDSKSTIQLIAEKLGESGLDLLRDATPDTKPTVLIAEKLSESGLELLRDTTSLDCSYGLSPEQLAAKISSCDALIVRSGTKVSREVFEAAKGRLRVVGRAGVGIDNVDLQAATEFGCLVVNAPTANTIAAAEHGIALLTAMARNVAQADASTKAGK